MTRNQAIKDALKSRGVAHERVAELLGTKRETITQRLNGEKEIDSIDFIQAVAKLTGYSFDELLKGIPSSAHSHTASHGFESMVVKEDAMQLLTAKELMHEMNKTLSGKNIRPVTVVVNQQGRELMTYVPVRAQAGYLKGYGDPHYIEKLPAFSLPILKDGSYRMFEVDGDSMLQQGGGGLHDGDIVISQYVEDFFTIKDRRVYVVISTDGICVKRCINRLKDKDNPILVCQSDNKNGQHPDIVIRPHEIIEVWELKAFISRQLGFATDLWDLLAKVESQVALMNEKIKRIEEERAGGGF